MDSPAGTRKGRRPVIAIVLASAAAVAIGFVVTGGSGGAEDPVDTGFIEEQVARETTTATADEQSADEQSADEQSADASLASPFSSDRLFRDANGTTLQIDLGADSPGLGGFVFAATDLGMVWGQAEVVFSGDIAHVSFNGDGAIDRDATIDPVFGFHETSFHLDEAAFTLTGDLDLSRGDATVEVVFDGASYHLATSLSVPDADSVLLSVVANANARDWAALYQLWSSGFQAETTESEFIGMLEDDEAKLGQLASLTLTGELEHAENSPLGGTWAGASATMTFNGPNGVTTRPVVVILVLEGTEWRFFSLDPQGPDVVGPVGE